MRLDAFRRASALATAEKWAAMARGDEVGEELWRALELSYRNDAPPPGDGWPDPALDDFIERNRRVALALRMRHGHGMV